MRHPPGNDTLVVTLQVPARYGKKEPMNSLCTVFAISNLAKIIISYVLVFVFLLAILFVVLILIFKNLKKGLMQSQMDTQAELNAKSVALGRLSIVCNYLRNGGDPAQAEALLGVSAEEIKKAKEML